MDHKRLNEVHVTTGSKKARASFFIEEKNDNFIVALAVGENLGTSEAIILKRASFH